MRHALCTYALCTMHCACTLHMHYAHALCTMYYALCTVLAPRTCTRHYALCTVLAPCTSCPEPTPDLCGVGRTERGGRREGGRGKKCHEKLLIYNTREDEMLVPKFIFHNMSFLEMQIPHREVYTLKIKPRKNDQIHGGPNQNILTIVVVVLVVIVVIVVTAVMFLESYPHDWCFPLPSPLRTTPSSSCQPAWHLPAARAPSGLTSRTLQRHKEQNRERPRSGGQGRM